MWLNRFTPRSVRQGAHLTASGEEVLAPSPVIRIGHFELNEPAAQIAGLTRH